MTEFKVVTTEQDRAFDLEEFKALRQEILLRIETSFRLEVVAATSAAAVYAWLGTRAPTIHFVVWTVPVFIALMGYVRSEKLGHQMYMMGWYLVELEKRVRPEPLHGMAVHGWEGHLRQEHIWKEYVDRGARRFWIVFIVLAVILSAVLPLTLGGPAAFRLP